ncbi:DUF58 domain-containing protein [Roseovarius atlanticus]|uniref:DUF58 domain-containing protein n=1 Tax=Roseovarius atlanticus TaxID=1641875 RepID=UPI001C9569CC|nr:hypothetical protein [Roseovarius atlanticus]MBY5989997.1 hypothetical protein [Roseovarius atlanticus]MBY6126542.1 hypothetical protein [Roseovarius atlanticus]MBY6151036.1 hypothetical protein [Roseovarius atlanticus]
MTDAALHLFDMLTWRLARALPGLRAGEHRGRMRGAGDSFADVAPLLAHPDPRRLDVRRSMLDPSGALFVRRFETRTDLSVHVLLDASASLATGSQADRQSLAGLLAAGFARAAWRGRDRFGISICAGPDLLESEPDTRRRGLDEELRQRIATLRPRGEGVEALHAAATMLPANRVLVVMISDFEFTADELDHLLTAIQPRPLLPIWLRDTGLEAPPEHLGLAETRDPETGRRRTVLTTRRWSRAQRARISAHRRQLRRVFADHGHRAIEIRDQLHVETLAAALDEAPL